MTFEHADLDAVVSSARLGDEAALQELMRRHQPRLQRMIRHRLDRRMYPRVGESDVLQETLIATGGAIGKYVQDEAVPFYAWLRRIAWRQLRRLCRQHVEAEKRTVVREQFALNNDSRAALCQQLISLSTPSRCAVRAETEQRMYAALDQLAQPDREILVLRYLEQMDSKEIAAVLQISEPAVRMRLMRAVRRIRAQLDDQESRP